MWTQYAFILHTYIKLTLTSNLKKELIFTKCSLYQVVVMSHSILIKTLEKYLLVDSCYSQSKCAPQFKEHTQNIKISQWWCQNSNSCLFQKSSFCTTLHWWFPVISQTHKQTTRLCELSQNFQHLICE